ncbi:hypothetical protein D3C87_1953790 [compost metagenome]
MGPRLGIGEQPVLAPDDKRFYRPLCPVVVDAQPPIFQVAHQFWPLLLAVANGLAQVPLRQHLRFRQPLTEFFHQRS